MLAAKPGDTLIICRVDRAFRDVLEGLQTIRVLQRAGIRVVCLEFGPADSPIDFSDPNGQFVLLVTLWFAENERRTLRKRTKEGQDAARRRGFDNGARAKRRRAASECSALLCVLAPDVVRNCLKMRNTSAYARTAKRAHLTWRN